MRRFTFGLDDQHWLHLSFFLLPGLLHACLILFRALSCFGDGGLLHTMMRSWSLSWIFGTRAFRARTSHVTLVQAGRYLFVVESSFYRLRFCCLFIVVFGTSLLSLCLISPSSRVSDLILLPWLAILSPYPPLGHLAWIPRDSWRSDRKEMSYSSSLLSTGVGSASSGVSGIVCRFRDGGKPVGLEGILTPVCLALASKRLCSSFHILLINGHLRCLPATTPTSRLVICGLP